MLKKENNYAFIDAANLFYGGQKSLGWKIDYQKLLGYLKDKYEISRALYFGGAVILSGDGDFLPVLKYLKNESKEITVLSRGPRTAREIRQFAGNNFRDFEYLKYLLTMPSDKDKNGLV
jgi:uncharacterized LabA/DUF88 family protein